MKQMAVGLRVAVPSLVVAFLVAACGDANGMPEGSAAVDAPAPEEAVDIAADSEASLATDASSLGTGGDALAATSDPDSAHGAADGVAADTTPAERTFFFFTRPDHIRGLYVNSWSAGSRRRMAALIDLARRTEVNTFVIDIKDASGYVSHPSEVPLAQGGGSDHRHPHSQHVVAPRRQLEGAGIYPVARIVIVKDPVLAAAHPELAVQDTAGGVWTDNNGVVWLNPFNKAVWEYHVDLAREVAEMGFPEIQWDYVRFPDAPASALGRAHFPGRNGQPRTTAIREFLAYSRDALADLEVDVTADVFGVTTSATRDVGIGQVWESFIDVVDVALPMVYPSHYWKGSYGFEDPNAHPYEIVRKALRDALERSASLEGAGATRPWLQDFTLGPPRYEAPEVRAQIQAAHDLGIMEWVLWNPGSRYTEDALEPAEGFAAEPMVRVGNQVVPVSMRFELFDTTTVVAQPDEEGGSGDGAPGPESGGTPAADTLPDPGAARPDTVGAGIGR